MRKSNFGQLPRLEGTIEKWLSVMGFFFEKEFASEFQRTI